MTRFTISLNGTILERDVPPGELAARVAAHAVKHGVETDGVVVSTAYDRAARGRDQYVKDLRAATNA